MIRIGKDVHPKTFETEKRYPEGKQQVEQKSNEIPGYYEGDIRRYLEYCLSTKQPDGTDAMLDYLYISLTRQSIKKTTWERRLAAIKKHLSIVKRIDFKVEYTVANEISVIRKMYGEEQNAELSRVKGKSAVDKQELLGIVYKLPTREKAICLINLITANKPSEMVRLKIKNFNLENCSVNIYLKNQGNWHTKRLNLESVKAVRDYIHEYQLKPDDYFVGRKYRGGRYESSEISEVGYTKSLQRWTGLTGYSLRKSQVVAMHEAGANLTTIAKQTGHKSLETISQRYLEDSDSTVDKYL